MADNPPMTPDRAAYLPPDQAARALLSLPESQWFERKSGVVKARDFALPLVAMANAEGGMVVAGLANGEIAPVSDKSDNELRQAAADFTNPPVRTKIHELATSAGRVLVFFVSPGDVIHETTRGDCYQRIGDESRRLTYAQRQELEWDRGAACFDATAAPDVTISDLNLAALTSYQNRLGSSAPDLALRARGLLTRDDRLTVAAYLLFGNRPQDLFPNAHVRVLKYADVDRGAGRSQSLEADSDVRCEGSIAQQLDCATKAIARLLPNRRALTDEGTFQTVPMIPKDAWLEGLVNALVHRSYSISGDHIRVEIFPNRIEISSPGRFPGLADPAHPESIIRNARNPRIARVCADIGVTQELGEGIRRIYGEMQRVGLSAPMYVQTTESVRLTLLASSAIARELTASLGQTAMKILDALRLAQKPLGTGQVAELVQLARPTALRHLNKLQDANLVSWQGESLTDPRATWRVN